MSINDGSYVALTKCFFCHEAGCLLLHQRFGDISEMHDKVCNMIPCSKCEDMMKQGIMIISIRDGQHEEMEREKEKHDRWRERQLSDHPHRYRRGKQDVPGFIPNPYRTGVIVVMRADAFERIFKDDMTTPGLMEKIKRHRWTFMEDSVCELTGIYDNVDKPDEVPFRVECRKKGLDPREEAIRLANVGRKADGKEKETEVPEQSVPAAGQDSPG